MLRFSPGVWILVCISVIPCWSTELHGAGASFPSEVYEEWMSAYRHHGIHEDLHMSYASIGSGKGKAILTRGADTMYHYVGSDSILTPEEQLQHPDLSIFPTMAGAIVLAYNIPTMDNLILNLGAVVGIYNGSITRWNDTLIMQLNPGKTLPGEQIVVIARADKSGTTEAFTSGLSSYSSEWKSVYGASFSEGINTSTEERGPIHWNSSVVKTFGNTNRGMSGLILSMVYSVGYVSIADAYKAQSSFASMKNREGNVVNASVRSVQSSILHSNHSSFSLMNMPGEDSFPLASYTFFIVHTHDMTNCDSAVELVKYVTYFYTSDEARNHAELLYMVPLDEVTAQYYTGTILQKMTCNGDNVWEMVQKQNQLGQESIIDRPWALPTYVVIGALTLIIFGLLFLFTRQQYTVHKELLVNTWNIDSSRVFVDEEIVQQQMRVIQSKNGRTSPHDLNMVVLENTWGKETQKIGVCDEDLITLFKIADINITIKRKKMILWMRDNIKHTNLSPFMGLSKFQTHWYMIHSGQVRGTLSDIFRNPKIQIQHSGVVALIKTIVSGMKFLHKKGIVHGHLKGSCCLIDTSWNLRIAAWPESKLCLINTQIRENKVNIITENTHYDQASFWTAPEVLKYKRGATNAADVYSFGMVVQEMYSRTDLYCEYNMQPSEVIIAVIACCLRPRFSPNTPIMMRELLEKTWEMDPAARPSFTAIEHMITASYPNNVTFLDCMIESIDQYSKSLERDIKDREQDMVRCNARFEALLRLSAPDFVVEKMLNKQNVDTERYENASVVACMISNLDDIVYHVTIKGFINTLNNLYTGLDQVLLSDDIYRIHRNAGTWSYVSGVPKLSRKHAKSVATIALKIEAFADRYNREHLNTLGTEIKLKTGIASGSVVAGVLGKQAVQYVVIGEPVDTAYDLMVRTEPNTIRIARMTYLSLKDDANFLTRSLQHKEGISYYLEAHRGRDNQQSSS